MFQRQDTETCYYPLSSQRNILFLNTNCKLKPVQVAVSTSVIFLELIDPVDRWRWWPTNAGYFVCSCSTLSNVRRLNAGTQMFDTTAILWQSPNQSINCIYLEIIILPFLFSSASDCESQCKSLYTNKDCTKTVI